MSVGFKSLQQVTLLENSPTCLKISFTLNADCPYFDGHFNNFLLLPAVAQLEIASRFAKQYWHFPLTLTKIKKLKFVNPIKPDSQLLLVLQKKNDTGMQFSFSSINQELSYSSGLYYIKMEVS